VKYHTMKAGTDGDIVSIRISQQLLWFFHSALSHSQYFWYTNPSPLQ
jgi:hypothetical protein